MAIAAAPKAGPGIVAPLVELFRGDLTVAARAAVALAGVGGPAVPALARAGSADTERSGQVRAVALFALGEMGPVARDALPVIRAGANDRVPAVRNAAARALRQVAGDR
jgi:HEAT repeat protein